MVAAWNFEFMSLSLSNKFFQEGNKYYFNMFKMCTEQTSINSGLGVISTGFLLDRIWDVPLSVIHSVLLHVEALNYMLCDCEL
jgi:hypothetical protein